VNPTVEQALESVEGDQSKRFLGRLLLRQIDQALPSGVLCDLVADLVQVGLPEVAAHLVALGQAVERSRARIAREED
jgi:hypothetical protein